MFQNGAGENVGQDEVIGGCRELHIESFIIVSLHRYL
jgi:hypothetical protein